MAKRTLGFHRRSRSERSPRRGGRRAGPGIPPRLTPVCSLPGSLFHPKEPTRSQQPRAERGAPRRPPPAGLACGAAVSVPRALSSGGVPAGVTQTRHRQSPGTFQPARPETWCSREAHRRLCTRPHPTSTRAPRIPAAAPRIHAAVPPSFGPRAVRAPARRSHLAELGCVRLGAGHSQHSGTCSAVDGPEPEPVPAWGCHTCVPLPPPRSAAPGAHSPSKSEPLRFPHCFFPSPLTPSPLSLLQSPNR